MMSGHKKAAVLPDPVFAIPYTSQPDKAQGTAEGRGEKTREDKRREGEETREDKRRRGEKREKRKGKRE